MTEQMYYVEVPRHKVKLIDYIVELAKFSKTTIESEKDWEIVQKLFEFFKVEFPEDYYYFIQSVSKIKSMQENENAMKKEGESLVQHQLEIPEKFAEMIMAIFPDQKFDKDFVRGLSKALPILKVAKNI